MLLALVVAAFPLGLAGTPPPDDEWIQPGGPLILPGGRCAIGLVYDGVDHMLGRVFITTSAHCVDGVGDLASTPGIPDFGTVVFLGNADAVAREYALIEILPQYHDRVNHTIRALPGTPRGTTVHWQTGPYDSLLFSEVQLPGQPSLVEGAAAVSKGVLVNDTAATYEAHSSAVFQCQPGDLVLGCSGACFSPIQAAAPPGQEEPLVFGCAGAPIVWAPPRVSIPADADPNPVPEGGQALGAISFVQLVSQGGARMVGPTYEGILSDATENGYAMDARQRPSCYPSCTVVRLASP